MVSERWNAILSGLSELDGGRPGAAVGAVEGHHRSGIGHAVALTARGLEHEREGRLVEAESCFGEAFDEGVPVAPVLRHCAGYFERQGDYGRAFECLAVLEDFDARPLAEFLARLAGPELVRTAPLALREPLNRKAPALGPVRAVKAALRAALEPEPAALAYAQMTGWEPGWDIITVPVMRLAEFGAANATVHAELSPGAESEQSAAPVVGENAGVDVVVRTRELGFYVLPDVVVSSKSNVLLAEDAAVVDWDAAHPPADLEADPIVFGTGDGDATLLVARGGSPEFDLEHGLALTGVRSSSFGHWLLEFLPRALICLGREGFESVPVLVDEQMPAQHLESLRALLGEEHPVLALPPRHALRVRELWTCSALSDKPLDASPGADPIGGLEIEGQVLVTLIEKVHPVLEQRPAGPQRTRIFLGSPEGQHPRPANAEEVEEWFEARGFDRHDFKSLPFTEQIRLVRDAEMIVGPSGSSLLMALFARPGTHVGILSGPATESKRGLAALLSNVGHSVRILPGDVVEGAADDPLAAYRVDVTRLAELIAELAASQAAARDEGTSRRASARRPPVGA